MCQKIDAGHLPSGIEGEEGAGLVGAAHPKERVVDEFERLGAYGVAHVVANFSYQLLWRHEATVVQYENSHACLPSAPQSTRAFKL